MSYTIQQIKSSLEGMGGGSSVDDVTNLNELMERAALSMLSRIDPLETMREQVLSQFVHDDLQNYTLPSDYKKLIDLGNVEGRESSDRASRVGAEPFSSELNIKNQKISIESNEGTKYLRINWKAEGAKTLHTMDSLTTNGTIAVVGTATGLKANTQYKLSGTASIEFDLVTTGDGIQCTGMTAVDLEDEETYADIIIPVYLSDPSTITSFTFITGNDLTTAYWTFVAQTAQADGTAFRAGWNYLSFPWTTATKTGSVTATAFDAWKLTVAGTALNNIRVDNILVSLGRLFNIKYYSKYLFRNSSGTWMSIPSNDTDTVQVSDISYQIFLLECLIAIYQQMKMNPKDYNFAKVELNDLYQRYRAEYPPQSKPLVDSYWSVGSFRR